MLLIEIGKHFENRVTTATVGFFSLIIGFTWIGIYCIIILVKVRSSSKFWINISCYWWKAETASGQIFEHSELVLETPEEQMKIKHHSPTVKIFIIMNLCSTRVRSIHQPYGNLLHLYNTLFLNTLKQCTKTTKQLFNQIKGVYFLSTSPVNSNLQNKSILFYAQITAY